MKLSRRTILAFLPPCFTNALKKAEFYFLTTTQAEKLLESRKLLEIYKKFSERGSHGVIHKGIPIILVLKTYHYFSRTLYCRLYEAIGEVLYDLSHTKPGWQEWELEWRALYPDYDSKERRQLFGTLFAHWFFSDQDIRRLGRLDKLLCEFYHIWQRDWEAQQTRPPLLLKC